MNDDSATFGRKVIEGGLWLSLGAFLVRLVGIITTIIVLRTVLVEEYGVYKLVLAAFAFLASFFISGFDPLVVNDAAYEKGEARLDRVKRLFFEYSTAKLLIGFILFLFTFFGAALLGRWYEVEIINLLPFVSFLFILVALERGLNLLLNIYLKFRYIALFTFIEEIGKLVLIIFLVVIWQWGAKGLIIADVLSTGVALLVFIPYGALLLKNFSGVSSYSRSVLWQMLKLHGKWGVATRYLDEVKRSIRPWLIKFFVGTEAVAFYSLAESLYGQVATLLPLSNVLAPLLPQEVKNRERVKRLLLEGTKYGTPLFAILGLVSFLAAPHFIDLFFPRYYLTGRLFSIMILGILTTAISYFITSILFAHRDQHLQFFSVFLTIFFMVAIGSLFLWSFGIWGVAIEFLLTLVFYNALRLAIIFYKYPELRFRFRDLFSWGRKDFSFLKSIVQRIFLSFKAKMC